MTSLYLSDILRRAEINPTRVKLIRHSVKHERFRLCYKKGFWQEYQSVQKEGFFNNCDYVLSFISEQGTSAKLLGCFHVGETTAANHENMPDGFPLQEMFDGTLYFTGLKKTDIFSDLAERLIIDWGKSTISWHQWATNEKPVLAITENPKYIFKGFDEILLDFSELEEIISDKTLYENWHTALSSVNAVYLIADKSDGRLYVGSAYGQGGLLGRWTEYIRTKHGGNKKLQKLLEASPERFRQFQFSVLQILPPSLNPAQVIEIESRYKKKLLSIPFGLNDN